MSNAISEFYQQNGYYVLTDAFSLEEIEALRNEATRICGGELGEVKGVVPPKTGATDDEILKSYLCIHFPHKLSPLMQESMFNLATVATLQQIIGLNVKAMQSMLFIKGAGKPGQAWHQDEYFIPTEDRSLTGGWIALDDATVENGCLWVIPGSHKDGIIWEQKPHNDPRYDVSGQAFGFSYTEAEAVPVEVKAGSVVFFNGYLLHRSLPNYAKTGYRRALVNHYMSAESLLPWFPSQEPDFRDVVLVAGEDPYAYKGISNLSHPFLRAEKQG